MYYAEEVHRYYMSLKWSSLNNYKLPKKSNHLYSNSFTSLLHGYLSFLLDVVRKTLIHIFKALFPL